MPKTQVLPWLCAHIPELGPWEPNLEPLSTKTLSRITNTGPDNQCDQQVLSSLSQAQLPGCRLPWLLLLFWLFSHHVQLSVTLWTAAGSLVFHYLPEFAQIHVHWVGNAIQPSHPLPSPSPFAFNQGLFQWQLSVQFSSVQSLSHVQLFATPWIAARQASLSITNSRSSLRLTSIESVMPSSHLILGHPLLLLPPIPPNIRVFSNESTLRMRRPKYWSFSFSIIASKEVPGLISFRMD